MYLVRSYFMALILGLPVRINRAPPTLVIVEEIRTPWKWRIVAAEVTTYPI